MEANYSVYVAAYQVVYDAVTAYINREYDLVPTHNEDHVYRNGFLKTFFTTDYTKLVVPSVYQTLEKYFLPDKNEVERQSDTILSRLKSTYADICGIVGYEYVTAIRANIVNGLVDSCLPHNKTDRKIITKFFNDYPFAIMAVIGSRYYTPNLFKTLKKNSMIYTPNTTSQGQPT